MTSLPDSVSRDRIRERLLAYMFPARPMNAEQDAALEKAILYQWLHDSEERERLGQEVPERVESFTAASYSVKFRDRKGSGISSTAKAVLLNAGLLYRGVHGRND